MCPHEQTGRVHLHGRGHDLIRPAFRPRLLRYPHIDEFTERGQIVIGYMEPLGPVAIAAEGRNTIAMLRRGKEETFKQLLARLDLAIESATVDHVYIDEVNSAEG